MNVLYDAIKENAKNKNVKRVLDVSICQDHKDMVYYRVRFERPILRSSLIKVMNKKELRQILHVQHIQDGDKKTHKLMAKQAKAKKVLVNDEESCSRFDYEKEYKKIKKECDELNSYVAFQRSKIVRLEIENDSLNTTNEFLRKNNDSLRKQIASMRQ